MLQHIPNLITIIRILLVLPVVYGICQQQYLLAVICFATAGTSDGLDGFLARKFSWTSRVGEILDPAADKLLLASTSVTLVLIDQFPVYLLLLLIMRDLIIVAGAGFFFFLTGPFQITPSRLGKFATFLQILLLLLVLLRLSAVGIAVEEWVVWLNNAILAGYWIAASAALLSGFTYIRSWTLHLVRKTETRGD